METSKVACNGCGASLRIVRTESAVFTELRDEVKALGEEVSELRRESKLRTLDDEWEARSRELVIEGKEGRRSRPTRGAAVAVAALGVIGGATFAAVASSHGPGTASRTSAGCSRCSRSGSRRTSGRARAVTTRRSGATSRNVMSSNEARRADGSDRSTVAIPRTARVRGRTPRLSARRTWRVGCESTRRQTAACTLHHAMSRRRGASLHTRRPP